jgi:general secretion pathway protein G
VPWPDALASTPITRKRSARTSSEPVHVVRVAPSTRASSAGVLTATGAGAGSGFAAGTFHADSAACVQYPAHSKALPINSALIKRRLASTSKFIMMHTSSTRDCRPCKRGRALLVRGFTLIELMVVLVIIGVLAALVVPNVLDRADDARVSAARVDVNNLMQALKLYRLDNQRYPTAEQGLAALVQRPDKPPVPTNWKAYIDKLPNDPWGQPYVYLNPGIQGEIDVMSYGADGQPGGDGKNADIGSWQ